MNCLMRNYKKLSLSKLYLPGLIITNKIIKNKLYHSSSLLNKSAIQLIVHEYGDPLKVVSKQEIKLPQTLRKNEVRVKFLASTINPADINTIQGVYAVKPDFPFIPGNEGIMEVVGVGEDVRSFSVGNKVIPLLNAFGTWRTEAIVNEDTLLKIPADIDIASAATISINPCSAYRMLNDFVSLKSGDVIVQNCANSAVGLSVIQIASTMGIKTINVIRDRPDLPELRKYMEKLGANLVLTEQEIRNSKELQAFNKPILALNGVCGRPTTDLMRILGNGATMVTYGGMSRKPLTIPVSSLIFKDLIFKGFWITRWNQLHKNDIERLNMISTLVNLIRTNKLIPPPYNKVAFSDYETALANSMPAGGMVGRKQILFFS